MSETFNKFIKTAVESQEQAIELMEKLFTVAQPGAVYGKPVKAEGYTVITASEVSVSMGFGFGSGGGSGTAPSGVETENDTDGDNQSQDQQALAEGVGGGGGGGGGGLSTSRPVAVISIGADGVRVEPVVDPTKMALALFTAIGSMFIMLNNMRKGSYR